MISYHATIILVGFPCCLPTLVVAPSPRVTKCLTIFTKVTATMRPNPIHFPRNEIMRNGTVAVEKRVEKKTDTISPNRAIDGWRYERREKKKKKIVTVNS